MTERAELDKVINELEFKALHPAQAVKKTIQDTGKNAIGKS